MATTLPVKAFRIVHFATFPKDDEATKARTETLEEQQPESQARHATQCDRRDPATVRRWIREVDLNIRNILCTMHIAATCTTSQLSPCSTPSTGLRTTSQLQATCH
jgi:hypothetical protein